MANVLKEGFKVVMPDSIAFSNINAFDGYIQEASHMYGIPFIVIKGMIAKESSFNPNAVPRNSNGELITSARGLMQLTKAAAEEVGYSHAEMFDPRKNILAGTAYLRKQIDRFGLWKGIKAYYAGAGTISRGENASLIADADVYASKVMGYATAFLLDKNTWGAA